MAAVHGPEHGDGFRAANLANDDAVGVHTQGVVDQADQVHGPHAFDVGRAGLEGDDVGVALARQPQLPVRLDGHGPLERVEEVRHAADEGRLPHPGGAGHHHLEAAPHRRAQEGVRLLVHHAQPGGVLPDDLQEGVAADGDAGVVSDEIHGVEAAAVGQHHVEDRMGHVEGAVAQLAAPGADPADELAHLIDGPADGRAGHLGAVGVDEPCLAGAVDDDVGDVGLGQEGLDRAQPEEHVVELLLDEVLLLVGEAHLVAGHALAGVLAQDLLDLDAEDGLLSGPVQGPVAGRGVADADVEAVRDPGAQLPGDRPQVVVAHPYPGRG